MYGWMLLLLLGMVVNAAYPPPQFKIWNKNTNFENLGNWDGYERNCSKNIYSFPMDMDPTVISIRPNSTISAKQIILPRNGHLVFQKGSTVLLNSPLETCQGTELKYRRTTRGDWFDGNNWNGDDSLLNSGAIPHVQRVPCQYDSVQFPLQSSFHLFISADVVVHKFFLGEEELNYTTVAFLMSSQLGKIQFKKASATQFNLERVNWEDNDKFICKNYEPQIRQKVCSFVRCESMDEKCGNPITPHGFCCPVCGFHIKIEHNGELPLATVRGRLDFKIESLGLGHGKVATYVGRYAQKLAHIVFIPWMNKTEDVGKLVDEIRIFLRSDSAVTGATVSRSWDDTSSSGLEGGGSSGGVTALIVLFVLFLIGVIAFLIFLWTKKGYPPLTLNSILSHLPSMPGIGGSGSSPRPSFSFARFSNERISNINIGATVSGEIQRTEEVDADAKPIEMVVPSGAELGGFGFSNATYDLIAVDDAKLQASAPSTIPEEDENIYDLVEINPDSSAILQGKRFEE